ncbi:membrane protein insertion efficiency factor YidD [Pseudosulfitobacter sp. SM2401]|jgi:putative component of membrane protein insertase Oxa1/YidC/SpoIIIJ protein YidD|uniref:membrane protein insertion efficiency factor YidD n=1 Tax=Pseudosulfitobacter sp. SM2401 TaxID=3350098 RepID=UPI0036F3A0E3
MLNAASLVLIRGYQTYLSPRKGYGCAYRLAHGGTGCSGYVKHRIAETGVIRAMPSIFQRFAACKRAALSLKMTAQADQNQPKKRKSRWYNYCDPCSACGYCGASGQQSNGCDLTPDCACAPDCCSF